MRPKAHWSWKEVLQVTNDEIAKKVIGMVAERMGVDDEAKITNETHFVNDMQADSLDLAELVIDMEEEFGVQISDEDAQGLETVGQAIKYIQEHHQE
jgi:acyl carrier protein